MFENKMTPERQFLIYFKSICFNVYRRLVVSTRNLNPGCRCRKKEISTKRKCLKREIPFLLIFRQRLI